MSYEPTVNVNQLNEHVELTAGMMLGSYRVLRKIGVGGMGAVYEVEHSMLHQRFALKTLFVQGDTEIERQDCADRFLQEARITAQLRHENIVSVQTLEQDAATKTLYFVMDYVAMSSKRKNALLHAAFGEHPLECWDETPEPTISGGCVSLSLEDLVTYGHRINRLIHPVLVRRIVADVAAALNYAHHYGSGVIHRDIKPANILIRPDGHAMVADFGVAKVADASLRKRLMNGQERSLSLRMQTNGQAYHLVLGTINYMAPELRMGEPPSPQTDLYALGVTMYQLLTGEIFSGEFLLPSTPPLNEKWEKILHCCLDSDPTHRYRTLGDLHTALMRMKSCYRTPWRALVRKCVICAGAFLLTILLYAVWALSLFKPLASPEEGRYVPCFGRQAKTSTSVVATTSLSNATDENVGEAVVEVMQALLIDKSKKESVPKVRPANPIQSLSSFLLTHQIELDEPMSSFDVQLDASDEKCLHLLKCTSKDADIYIQHIAGYTLNVKPTAFKGMKVENLYVNTTAITYERNAFRDTELADVWYNAEGGLIPRTAFGKKLPSFWDRDWNAAYEEVDGAKVCILEKVAYLFEYESDEQEIVMPTKIMNMNVEFLDGCLDKCTKMKRLVFEETSLLSETNKKFLLTTIIEGMIKRNRLEAIIIPYATSRLTEWLKKYQLEYDNATKCIRRKQ